MNQIGATSPNADTRNADIVKKTKQKERHIHTTERTRALWGLGARGWGAGARMVIRSEWSFVLTKAK